MISQTFLDLSTMLLKENWDINFDPVEVQSTMEEYFDKEYVLDEVKEAIDMVITEQLSNQNDYIN